MEFGKNMSIKLKTLSIELEIPYKKLTTTKKLFRDFLKVCWPKKKDKHSDVIT